MRMRIVVALAMLAALALIAGCTEGSAAASRDGARADLRLGRSF